MAEGAAFRFSAVLEGVSWIVCWAELVVLVLVVLVEVGLVVGGVHVLVVLVVVVCS